MDTACREFVRALKQAQSEGAPLNLLEITRRIEAVATRTRVLEVFDECKRRGWVGGSAWNPWLTNEGEKIE